MFKPKRGEPMEFDPRKHPELNTELFHLIKTAYAEIGGHAKVNSPSDVTADPDWNFWEGIEIHNEPGFDVISFGHKGPYGIKFSGLGHDGTKAAKSAYLGSRGTELHIPGHYMEVSGKLAEILIGKYKVPVISDRETVEKVLNKKVEWLGKNPEGGGGDGWYARNIGGHRHAKILIGSLK